MLTVLLGLSGALIFGASDFIGGIASKRISAMRVTALGGASGLIVLIVLLPLVGGRWSAEAALLGALSGVSGAIAIALLYRCLAIGPMSILSPLTAVVSAIVPVTVGLVRGERFEPIGYLAIGLALVAVVLVGFVPDRRAIRPSGPALLMATGAGVLIGIFLIVIDSTPEDSGLVPLIFNRGTNAVLLFTTIGVLALVSTTRARGASPRPGADVPSMATRGWRPGFALAVTVGMVDALANVLILLALRMGDLTVVSVLTAMYPAGTIVLAAVVLRERVAPSQIAGLVLAIGSAALLALS